MATIIDIARRAGVSVATVSRTFSHPDKVRSGTREKVRKAVAELDYSPNALARSLRQMRSGTVIVIVPSIQNTFFSGIVQGVENVAHDNGFRVLLGETQGRQERLDYYAAMVSSRVADGLILLGSLLPGEVTERMKEGAGLPMPLVLACERFEDLTCPHVAIDNEKGAYEATRHLIDQGCRRIATVSGPAGNTLSQDRVVGYRRALAEAELPFLPDYVLEGDFTVESGYSAMADLLLVEPRADGIFFENDEMAIGALRAIREAGLSVPGDFAIVGFDDIRFAEFVDPPLSTIRQPTVEIGEAAMELMMRTLRAEDAGATEIILDHQLIIRASSDRSAGWTG
ncbi:LacI family DNA-binding transcriptional regulator [Novosphingobium sp. PY1]|uniref:LacI family DNA-binding transcriptional regulator n=1 Tax=Novosphingobium sp. PY1 TaxID=1882221 RepID=UPI000BE78117|nr:LacI family DNA-binding transcriptional regulator [Novosphingobium sp. PY1]BBA74025.1 periplasmic-binding protein/LacI transcriptional regulator [Novosphingobium sp. PY1]GFM31262.1 periplasmic-binding protein/LacI transcriptional regulator [Novosphingobium sp. PY1]